MPRLLLINPESTIQTAAEYRLWPHLGLLTVSTVAHEVGWDVMLWDELHQGPIDLTATMKADDIIGLSLVVTGLERGVQLARQAKQLGARAVIAGNDAAIFRSTQLLALPDRPIDAILTSNSTDSLRRVFEQLTEGDIDQLRVTDVATRHFPRTQQSNEPANIKQQQAHARRAGDGFVIPKLDLFSPNYWEQMWNNHRQLYGDTNQRTALIHLAQGCGRTGEGSACSYCSIYGIGETAVASAKHITQTLTAYQDFGINSFFNVTDSSFEMMLLARRLHEAGFRAEYLTLYGRARSMSQHPEWIDRWSQMVNQRLIINCGMDSGDETILRSGVEKSHSAGSRLQENRTAILNLKHSGAHLHYSLIFGSPGETTESCQRSLDFVDWSRDQLGRQLDVVETDLFWLNHGSAASRVLRDYHYARELAERAGKSITPAQWQTDFGQHCDALTIPESTQEAWYRYFTSISIDQARDYNRLVAEKMSNHPQAIPGRKFAFR